MGCKEGEIHYANETVCKTVGHTPDEKLMATFYQGGELMAIMDPGSSGDPAGALFPESGLSDGDHPPEGGTIQATPLHR